uniref:Uncharacterized protein n=2 Tax=Physcomitrium patens TaxID=3218 RepID=A0A7I4AVX0_PHYPA
MLACEYAFILVLLVTTPCSAARILRDGSGNSSVEESHKTGKLLMKWIDRQTGDGNVPARLEGSDRMHRQWVRLLIEEIHIDYAEPAPNPSAPHNATP